MRDPLLIMGECICCLGLAIDFSCKSKNKQLLIWEKHGYRTQCTKSQYHINFGHNFRCD